MEKSEKLISIEKKNRETETLKMSQIQTFSPNRSRFFYKK